MAVEATTTSADIDTELDPTRPGTDERIVSRNPATGAIIDDVPVTIGDDLDEVVESARDAQGHWGRLPAEERAQFLLDAREAILDHRTELRDLAVEETGKARVDALGEMMVVLDSFGYYANRGPELLADEKLDLHLMKNKRVTVQHAPAGLALNISPWNFPIDLAISPIIPALIAGNAVIVKPSEWTTLTALRAVEIINRSGLPDGILQVAPGYGETGAALVERADAVSFTGSVATGRHVATAAAQNFVPSTLELGGKDPCIVLEDANLERAASGAVWGAFFNAGQCCMSIERVFAHEAIYDEFVERVVEKTRALRQGVPGDGDVDVGAITFPKQLETIESHVQSALEAGATALTGGERAVIGEGDFFEPTVLVDVEPDMEIMVEETFGPVMPIMKVSSAAEAIRHANESRFGLNSSIWSTNHDRARRLARQLEAGNVCINDVIASYGVPEAPYGGIKESGMGRRKGAWEIADYTEPKTILEDIIGLDNEPYWYPYSDRLVDGVDKAFEALFRRGLTGKLRGLFQ